MSIAQRIDRVLDLAPDSWAIEYQERRMPWRDIRSTMSALARLFEARGIDARFTIGLLGRNHPSIAAAYVATLGLERSVTLLNPARPLHQVAQELQDLRLACVIGLAGDLSPALLEAARAVGSLVLVVGDGVSHALVDVLQDGGAAGDFRLGRADTLIEIQTSGTTGAPKRIPISRRTLEGSLKSGVRSAAGETDAEALTLKRSPTLMFGPLVHTSGTFGVLMSVFEARPIVLFDKFDPQEFKRKLVEHRPKFTALPPTALRMLLDSDATRDDLSSLLAVRCGTAPLAPEVQQRFEDRFGVPVLTNYGATEFLGTVASWALNEYKQFGSAKRGSVGRANPGVQLQVVDPASFVPVAAGEVGILEAKVGRLDGGKAWVRTSDLARIDSDGFLFLVGRADDAIIRGGFKVMAEKVADAVRLHPSVLDCIVLGMPDERLGQVPVALVEGRAGGAQCVPAELKAFVREHLAPYEVPVRFVVVDALPRTVSDKVSRPAALQLLSAQDER